MALSVDYVVRETATNLKRNLLMTSAAVLTVAVSLSLVGGALLLKQGVANATSRWRGGVELSIFMDPAASEPQNQAISNELSKMPEVKKTTYVGQEEAFEEFKKMFADQPDLIESVTAQDLPPSYRVVPKQPEFAEVIGRRFEATPGVREVQYAEKQVQTLLKVTRVLQIAIYLVAGVLGVSATLLILNSIRMAIFERRREVAVMKLVGATNWFIRVPFMLEGMVQGLLGAVVAFFVVFLGRGLVARAVPKDLQLVNQLIVSRSEAIGTGLFILMMGALVGALGSALGVRRHLDV